MTKRDIQDVLETLENGEFYQDYDQSVSDLAIIRNVIKALDVMSEPGWHSENMRAIAKAARYND